MLTCGTLKVNEKESKYSWLYMGVMGGRCPKHVNAGMRLHTEVKQHFFYLLLL